MKNKISKSQKKELIKRVLVIIISVILSAATFIEYPQLIYALPLAWIITGIGNILGYGSIDGLFDHIERSANQIRIIIEYLTDTYKLWKLL